MKILVAYYSKTGNTRKVANDLAKRLKADIDEITDLANRSGIWGWLMAGRDEIKGNLTKIRTAKDPSKYDLVILGTPFWVGGSTPAVRTYLSKFKKQLKKVAIFNTAGSDGIEKTQKLLEKTLGRPVIASMGWTSQELRDEAVYEEKMNRLVEMLK